LLFSHLATLLSLELVKPLDLLSRQNASHFGANANVRPDLIRLGRRQGFGRPLYFSLAIWFAHYRAIESLTSLSQTPTGGNDFVVVASANLLHSHPLVGCKPDCLHQALLLLLFLELVRIERPIAADLGDERRSIDSTLSSGQSVVALNLTCGVN
jgi:hypothetical protein